ncbi:hypothetical protein Salat_2086800 [Sesamum alatum]|uniref:Reverse transcriptase zinc-binding domain-containing protein n=1 Tax=Sesamum alatum TaxID=300844 RepID=A0AAE1Y1K2_9LAMI|nr:hypothetical protein Salat_2086800 [Sesamum alatum]
MLLVNSRKVLPPHPPLAVGILFWHSKVPLKVHVFAWKACRNDLPTMNNLATRMNQAPSCCPLCSDPHGTIPHALSSCSVARQTWALSNLPSRITDPGNLDTEDWLRRAQKALESDNFCLLLCTACAIWFNRNSTLMENSPFLPHAIVCYARSYLQAFQEIPKLNSGESVPLFHGAGALLFQAASKLTSMPQSSIKHRTLALVLSTRMNHVLVLHGSPIVSFDWLHLSLQRLLLLGEAMLLASRTRLLDFFAGKGL